MKKTLCAALAAMTFLCLAACQKTPEKPIIIGKQNNDWRVNTAPAEKITEIDAPESYEAAFTEGDLTVNINAAVDCPKDRPFPVYVLSKSSFTQEQADKIISALIGDAELYDIENARTKKTVEREIEYYTDELNASGDFPENQKIYTEKLAELIAELETAPEEETVSPASRTLEFKENQDIATEYGQEITTKDGGFRFIWTEQARKKAAADGNAEISGVCTMPNGSRKRIAIKNRPKQYNYVQFGNLDEDPDLGADAPPTTQAEAIAMGNSLLEQMGLEYQFLGCEPSPLNDSHFMLSYCTAIPGTNAESVTPAPIYNAQAEYNVPISQETIRVSISGNGAEYFYWQSPVKIDKTDSQNMELLSWEETAEVIEKGLRIKNLWDYDDENVVKRRLEIYRICLSYMQVKKDSDTSVTYYIPVWDVIGNMHCIYSENYVPSSGGFLVDENNERTAYEDCSVLTVNAIDGSIIDRGMGF